MSKIIKCQLSSYLRIRPLWYCHILTLTNSWVTFEKSPKKNISFFSFFLSLTRKKIYLDANMGWFFPFQRWLLSTSHTNALCWLAVSYSSFFSTSTYFDIVISFFTESKNGNKSNTVISSLFEIKCLLSYWILFCWNRLKYY